MALEKDFQALDDYLNNKLSAEEHKAFEDRLNQDAELRNELDFQHSIKEGLKQARIAQLKGMLNNIPVSSIPTSHTTYLVKVGTWVAATGLIATATYFILTKQADSISSQQPTEAPLEQTPPAAQQEPDEHIQENLMEPEESKVLEKEITTKKKNSKTSVSPKRPTQIEIYNPSVESKEATEKYELEQLAVISKAFVTSSIEVETNVSDRKHNFHYLFKDNKLLLFGTFEKNLYEILEFIGDNKRTVVLYYKSTYYLLDLNKTEPTQLVPIKNKNLLNKLKQLRGN
jgi:hypothetical protein